MSNTCETCGCQYTLCACAQRGKEVINDGMAFQRTQEQRTADKLIHKGLTEVAAELWSIQYALQSLEKDLRMNERERDAWKLLRKRVEGLL